MCCVFDLRRRSDVSDEGVGLSVSMPDEAAERGSRGVCARKYCLWNPREWGGGNNKRGEGQVLSKVSANGDGRLEGVRQEKCGSGRIGK